jgi:hypothetical protein
MKCKLVRKAEENGGLLRRACAIIFNQEISNIEKFYTVLSDLYKIILSDTI